MIGSDPLSHRPFSICALARPLSDATYVPVTTVNVNSRTARARQAFAPPTIRGSHVFRWPIKSRRWKIQAWTSFQMDVTAGKFLVEWHDCDMRCRGYNSPPIHSHSPWSNLDIVDIVCWWLVYQMERGFLLYVWTKELR